MGSFRRTVYLMGWVFLLLGIGPLVVSALAGWIAGMAGCTLEKTAEDQAVTCMIGGSDRGELLYGLSLLRWIWVFSLPVAVIGAAMIVLRFGMDVLRRR
jgi:hypothetical protein